MWLISAHASLPSQPAQGFGHRSHIHTGVASPSGVLGWTPAGGTENGYESYLLMKSWKGRPDPRRAACSAAGL